MDRDKIVFWITLAAISLVFGFAGASVSFELTNEPYQIVVTDYSQDLNQIKNMLNDLTQNNQDAAIYRVLNEQCNLTTTNLVNDFNQVVAQNISFLCPVGV